MDKVITFDNQLKTHDSLTPLIPFVSLLIGARGSGKTTLLLNMIFNIYNDKFDDCYIVSPTYQSDTKLQLLEKKEFLRTRKVLVKKSKYFDYLEEEDNKKSMNPVNVCLDPEKGYEILEKIRALQTRVKPKDRKEILLVLDDILGSKFIKSNDLKMFVANSRHLKTSIIISSQAYKSIEKTVRLNTTYLVLFPTGNIAELKMIYEENNTSNTQEEFIEKAKNVFNETGRHFICINALNNFKMRLIKDMNSYI